MLERAGNVADDPVQSALLRVEYLAARNRLDEAGRLVEKTLSANPDRVELHVVQAGLTELAGNTDDALRLLERARGDGHDSVELRLAVARHWRTRKPADAAEALESLEQDAGLFTEDDRNRLYEGLAELHELAGNTGDVERLWKLVAVPAVQTT